MSSVHGQCDLPSLHPAHLPRFQFCNRHFVWKHNQYYSKVAQAFISNGCVCVQERFGTVNKLFKEWSMRWYVQLWVFCYQYVIGWDMLNMIEISVTYYYVVKCQQEHGFILVHVGITLLLTKESLLWVLCAECRYSFFLMVQCEQKMEVNFWEFKN